VFQPPCSLIVRNSIQCWTCQEVPWIEPDWTNEKLDQSWNRSYACMWRTSPAPATPIHIISYYLRHSLIQDIQLIYHGPGAVDLLQIVLVSPKAIVVIFPILFYTPPQDFSGGQVHWTGARYYTILPNNNGPSPIIQTFYTRVIVQSEQLGVWTIWLCERTCDGASLW
jgi:hypothetical protein